jgi:hypothetical protein
VSSWNEIHPLDFCVVRENLDSLLRLLGHRSILLSLDSACQGTGHPIHLPAFPGKLFLVFFPTLGGAIFDAMAG